MVFEYVGKEYEPLVLLRTLERLAVGVISYASGTWDNAIEHVSSRPLKLPCSGFGIASASHSSNLSKVAEVLICRSNHLPGWSMRGTTSLYPEGILG